MKIRLDFVTNSSSSSFVAYAIYSEELWDFIQELIDNGELTNKRKGWDGYYGLTACSYMSHIDQGVSITVQLGELGSNEGKRFNIFRNYEEEDERSLRETVSDDENAKSLGYLHSAVSHFFDSLSSASFRYNYNDKDLKLDEILTKALSENKVRARTFMDFTDGFVGEEVFRGYEPPVAYWMDGETLAGYSEQPGITTIHIPSTVKVIGSNAFRDSNQLTGIIVPDSVKTIKNAAFRGCKSLTEIQLPETITQLENNTFRDCKSLESVVLPKSVKSIGDRAFMGCSSLKSFSAEGLAFIGKDAFKGCKSLTNILEIEQHALDMQGEGLLKDKIVVHTGFSKTDEDRIAKITTASGGTVKSSVVLKTDILIYNPDYDHETTKLKRAKELNAEGKNIKIVTLDVFISSIEKGDVGELDKGSLQGSFDLVDAIDASETKTARESVDKEPSTVWEYKKNEQGVVITAYLGTDSELEIPEQIEGTSVTEIGDEAFSTEKSFITLTEKLTLEKITTITLPKTIRKIGNGAFEGCKNLEKIELPDDIEAIGENAFRRCRSLKEFIFPRIISTIEKSILSGCSNLKSITIPDKVMSIGAFAFEKCSSLSSISIPNGVTSIGWNAFMDCTALDNVLLPDSLTIIESAAFQRCSSLKEIHIPQGVSQISDLTFAGCSSLTKMTIPDCVRRVGSQAFDECTGLEELTISCGVETIDSYAFSNCNKLETVIIPDSVKYIGDRAFLRCKNLKSIVISDSVTKIENTAFMSCNNLTIYTPKNSYAAGFALLKSIKTKPINEINQEDL